MIYLDTLDELFNYPYDFQNKYHQIETYSKLIDKVTIIVDNTRLIDQHVRKAFKIDVLRKLPRYSTKEINKIYNINYDKDAFWIKLYENKNVHYFAVGTIDGYYLRAKINTDNNNLTINNPKNYGTTNNDYVNRQLAYSRFTFDRKEDLGITEHSLVALAFGMYDNLTLNELAVSSINHKNKNHYDNRPCNIEVVNIKDNIIHKKVSNQLISYGVFRSLDIEHSKKFINLDYRDRIIYIETLKNRIKTDNDININNKLIDDIYSKLAS